ncbi:MAG: hypothetical protein Q8T08_24485 [Ignavibacteria bacterium]|nr:hypothetical protein [Ignavibacteria bacterium]
MKKLLTLAILFTGSCSPNDENAQGNTLSGNEISIEINYGKIDFISEFLPGITHTQNSIDPWDEPKAAAEAENIAADFLNFDIDVFIGGGYDYFTKREDGRNLVNELIQKRYTEEQELSKIEN